MNVRVLRTATTHLFILLQTIVSGIIVIVQRSIFAVYVKYGVEKFILVFLI